MRPFTAVASLGFFLFACVGDSPTTLQPGVDAGSGLDAAAPDGGALDAARDAAQDAPPAPAEPPLVAPKLWLDARKIAPGNAPSKTWKDESGNKNDATSGIALSLEASAINGRPAMYLPGETDQALQVPATGWGFTIGDGFCIIFVAKTKKTAVARTAQAVFFDRSLTSGIFPNAVRYGSSMYLDSALTKSSAFVFTSTGGQITSTSEVTTDVFAPHIYVFRVAGSRLDTWVDGTRGVVSAAITPNDFASANTAPFAIGGYASTTNAQFTYNGHLGEVLVYNRVISDTDLNGAIAKLRAEWAIP